METTANQFSEFFRQNILMMKPVLASVCLGFALATLPVTPANAAGGEEAGSGNSNKTLDLSNMVLPVEQDGKLVNYLFVSAVITLNDGFDHWKLRESAHIIRDFILKEAHKTTIGLEGHPMKMDEAKFKEVVTRVFDREVGQGSIKSIEILASDSQKIFVDG